MDSRHGAWPDEPRPRKGGGMVLTGLLFVVGTFLFIVWMAVIGGTHTLYTLIPLLIGLPLLMVGLAKRGSG
jgi:hypothetical protein